MGKKEYDDIETVILTISKESAINKVTKEHSDHIRARFKENNSTVELWKNDKHWRAELVDYKIKTAEVKTSVGESESGRVGTKMTYRGSKRSGRECREILSGHEI